MDLSLGLDPQENGLELYRRVMLKEDIPNVEEKVERCRLRLGEKCSFKDIINAYGNRLRQEVNIARGVRRVLQGLARASTRPKVVKEGEVNVAEVTDVAEVETTPEVEVVETPEEEIATADSSTEDESESEYDR